MELINSLPSKSDTDIIRLNNNKINKMLGNISLLLFLMKKTKVKNHQINIKTKKIAFIPASPPSQSLSLNNCVLISNEQYCFSFCFQFHLFC